MQGLLDLQRPKTFRKTTFEGHFAQGEMGEVEISNHWRLEKLQQNWRRTRRWVGQGSQEKPKVDRSAFPFSYMQGQRLLRLPN